MPSLETRAKRREKREEREKRNRQEWGKREIEPRGMRDKKEKIKKVVVTCYNSLLLVTNYCSKLSNIYIYIYIYIYFGFTTIDVMYILVV